MKVIAVPQHAATQSPQALHFSVSKTIRPFKGRLASSMKRMAFSVQAGMAGQVF
jgi:hypothetical protein